MVETVIFDHMSPHCDPALEDSKPIFLHDLWPMMIHHHTKFGYKRFSSWGDIIQKNIHWNSDPFLWPWLWPQQSDAIFFTRLIMVCHQTKFGSKRISSSEDIIETVIFWSYEPLLWPWPWKQQTNLFAWHSGWWCITMSSLVTKCLAVLKISSGQTLTFWPFTVTLTLNAVI